MSAPLSLRTAWIARVLFDEMKAEAQRATPNETGGVFMGYWSRDGSEVVITEVIGPGPAATHRPGSFTPDAGYQEAEIARHYQGSGRLHTYLGDWHTHPGGSARLSRRDRRTISKIARAAAARAPVLLMGILGGWSSWQLAIWRGSIVRTKLLYSRLRVDSLEVQIF